MHQIHSEAPSLCIRLDSQLKNNNITMISSCTKSKQYFNYCFLQMCAKKVSLLPNSVKSLMKNYAEGSTIHGILNQIHSQCAGATYQFYIIKTITSRAGDSILELIHVVRKSWYMTLLPLIASIQYVFFPEGVQYLTNTPIGTRLLWSILVALALAGAAIFALNVFSDWQVETR